MNALNFRDNPAIICRERDYVQSSMVWDTVKRSTIYINIYDSIVSKETNRD